MWISARLRSLAAALLACVVAAGAAPSHGCAGGAHACCAKTVATSSEGSCHQSAEPETRQTLCDCRDDAPLPVAEMASRPSTVAALSAVVGGSDQRAPVRHAIGDTVTSSIRTRPLFTLFSTFLI